MEGTLQTWEWPHLTCLSGVIPCASLIAFIPLAPFVSPTMQLCLSYSVDFPALSRVSLSFRPVYSVPRVNGGGRKPLLSIFYLRQMSGKVLLWRIDPVDYGSSIARIRKMSLIASIENLPDREK